VRAYGGVVEDRMLRLRVMSAARVVAPCWYLKRQGQSRGDSQTGQESGCCRAGPAVGASWGLRQPWLVLVRFTVFRLVRSRRFDSCGCLFREEILHMRNRDGLTDFVFHPCNAVQAYIISYGPSERP